MSDVLRRILDLVDTPDGTDEAKQRARRRLRDHITAAEAASAPLLCLGNPPPHVRGGSG